MQTPQQPKPSPEWAKQLKGSGTLEDPWKYTTPQGNTLCWNPVSNSWVPEEALVAQQIAQQQAAYGSSTSTASTTPTEAKQQEGGQSTKRKQDQSKDEKTKGEQNQKQQPPQQAPKHKVGSVYITGLPHDIADSDVVEYFAKCGLIKKDPETAQPKVKVYKDEEGKCKGDALVCYYRPESVDIAIQILDESEIRPGFPIKVQKATFQKKGPKDTKKKKKPPSKKAKLYDQQKELSWEEDDTRHVVIRHLFDLSEAKVPNFFADLEEELREECGKLGGVEKVKIFERNPLGVVVIKFEDHATADRCVNKMNGRFFAGRKLEAEFYDGWTNYDVKESEEEQQKRIDEFGDWLGKDDEDEDDNNKKTQ